MDQDLRDLAPLVHRDHEALQSFAFLFPEGRLFFPPPSLVLVFEGRNLSEGTPADVLPDHPAIFLAGAGVVEAAAFTLLPGAHGAPSRCVTSLRVPRFSLIRASLLRTRFDSAMRGQPSPVFGPVERPLCIRQRPLTC